MDKNQLFEDVKEDMLKTLGSMELGTISESKEQMILYFSFLESLLLLPTPVVDESNEEEVSSPGSIVEHEAAQECEIDRSKSITFMLERKLKGAYLQGTDIKVSESIIRHEGFKHGDLISYELINGKLVFTRISESLRGDAPNRKQIDYALVEQDGHMLVIRKEYKSNSDIKIDDVPFTFRVSDKDIQDLRLEPGDIVDLAYYENRPEATSRVIWKHNIEEVNREAKCEAVAKKIKKEPKVVVNDFVPLLEGIHVLVVGAEMKKRDYQEKIELHQGIYDWIDGNEEINRIKSKVKRADLVIFIKRFINHPRGNKIKNMCKQYEVPFSQFIDNFSPDKIVEEAVKLRREYELRNAE